ncbi:hypothetical protein DEO72_LG8g2008 [Vigna unguiculata]|uniref:Uncharacterized protein n=1 Tax=Vigna unguiculata TaxID=3917 RepID=A0A4D6MR58_VIGUN|nr:hypothetical protein DEO72_LG8g2008 [Vigna unguiculata]
MHHLRGYAFIAQLSLEPPRDSSAYHRYTSLPTIVTVRATTAPATLRANIGNVAMGNITPLKTELHEAVLICAFHCFNQDGKNS